MDSDLIELVRFQYAWQAQILSEILDEESIESFVTESNALGPAMGFVVYVSNQNREKAQLFLKAFDESNVELSEGLE